MFTGLTAIEGLENAMSVFFRNTRPLVVHADRNAAVSQTARRQHNLGARLPAVANGIGNKVRQNALDEQGVRMDGKRQRTSQEEKSFGGGNRSKFGGKLGKKLRNAHIFHLDVQVSGLNAADFQKLLNQRRNVLRGCTKLRDDILGFGR